MSQVAIGFDVGGHHIRGAAVTEEGKILFRKGIDTPKTRSPEDILSAVEGVYLEIRTHVPKDKLSGAGFGFPGFLDGERGVILRSPNFPLWNNFHLKEALSKRFSGPFRMDNDANCAALGEAWLGASVDVRHSILVTLGTGVGGGIIVDGKLLRGVHGAAAEFGHAVIEPDGPACGCGGNGCLERLISGDSIKKDTGKGAEEWAQLAKQGNAEAKKVFEKVGRLLGIAFTTLCHTFDPELLILGGRMADAAPLFLPSLEKEFRGRTKNHPSQDVKITTAKLGDDAGLLGAAWLVLKDT